jgi:hypothetical protein
LYVNFGKNGFIKSTPDRVLMNFAAADFNVRSLNEQKGLSLLFCNMFATPSRRWLMYFSEWTTHDGELTSNAEVPGTYVRVFKKVLLKN